jgi:hypothetical protein
MQFTFREKQCIILGEAFTVLLCPYKRNVLMVECKCTLLSQSEQGVIFVSFTNQQLTSLHLPFIKRRSLEEVVQGFHLDDMF